MSHIKAVLFDFDGTIEDTNQVIVESWQYTAGRSIGHDLPMEPILGSFGEPLLDCLAKVIPGWDPEQLAAWYREYQFGYDGYIGMFPGIREMVAELKAAGYTLGIVTSRDWNRMPRDLYHFDIGDQFDAVISAESTSAHKPDPEPLQRCLQKLGLQPDEAVYVGDSRLDMLCAKNAGIKCILVGWSLCYPPEKASGIYVPDYVVEKPSDLPALLARID